MNKSNATTFPNVIVPTLQRIASIPAIGPIAALLAACVFFSMTTDRFLTGQNFSLILQQVMVVGALAIGQTIIILTSGIDLSCGMVMAFSSIIMSTLSVRMGWPPILAIGIGLLVSVLFGIFNGTLVTLIKLPPLIVTLGTLNIAYALTHIFSKEQTTVIKGADAILFLGNTFKVGGTAITYGSVFLIILFVVAWLVLRYTAGGRYVYAVGDNMEATRLSGISTTRLLITIYAIGALMYGVAGLLLLARTGVGDPQAGFSSNTNLDSILAVVLGGTSILGGRGNILGSLVGALIVGVFRNGLQLMGIESIYQSLITGALFILTVSFDTITHWGK
jgi:fructose transport system permease protein